MPLENGPTAVIPGTQYPAVDRVDQTTNLHVVNSEDGFPAELPEHLQHVISSEDRLHSDVPNSQGSWPRERLTPMPEHEDDEERAFAEADANRMLVAAAMLGEDELSERKLTCKAGTVVLVRDACLLGGVDARKDCNPDTDPR